MIDQTTVFRTLPILAQMLVLGIVAALFARPDPRDAQRVWWKS